MWRRPAHRASWVLTLLGFAGWVGGDLVWTLEQHLFPDHYPAPSDAVYLASYLALGAGVLRLTRSRRHTGDRVAALNAAIVATGAATLLGAFVVLPITTSADLSLAAKLVSTAYPVGDLFLLTVLIRVSIAWNTSLEQGPPGQPVPPGRHRTGGLQLFDADGYSWAVFTRTGMVVWFDV